MQEGEQRPSLLELVGRLSDPHRRQLAAAELAASLGAHELLLLVRDPELYQWLPATGMAQTLSGGRAWRTLLVSCHSPGIHQAMVDLPRSQLRPAVAVAGDDVTAVLLGGTVATDALAPLAQSLPLLGALLRAQQQVAFGEAEVVEARQAVVRAHALAESLDAARSAAARLNAELRLEHQRKDEFLAMLGHELRNPLSPLASAIEVLRRPHMQEHAPRLLDMMSRQVSHLARVVEDLLDVSRVTRGHIELRREPVSLQLIAHEALEASRSLIEVRHHTVELNPGHEPLVVHVDRLRLTQVIGNLLNNAAKYTSPGGRIVISLAREENDAVLEVSDNGIGIAPAMLHRIFDMFAQVPMPLDRAEGGLGVGLTLVRILVELHGGQVDARSGGLGLGSSFRVRLPLAVHVPAAPLEAPPAPTLASASVAQTGPLHVLVVDDNVDAADSLAELFRALGHNTAVAYDGPTALAQHTREPADLILLDIGLPGMDGYEVARRLRRGEHSDVRIVALTGYGSEEDQHRSLAAGIDKHLVKPPSLSALEAVLAGLAPRRPPPP